MLLGDAALPMYPVGSNGAFQAIVDARVLVREPALQPSIEAATAAHDAQRRPQTASVVLGNRQGGPERCIGIVEQCAPDGFVDLEGGIGRAELEAIARRYNRAAGFDPEVLTTCSSLGGGPHRAHGRQIGGSPRPHCQQPKLDEEPSMMGTAMEPIDVRVVYLHAADNSIGPRIR
jgi:hypothetical protein